MNPKIKMKVLTPCENCIQDRELVDEIIKLYEHVTELEAVIYDLENQILERKQELYVLF